MNRPTAPIDLHDPASFARGIPQEAFAVMRAQPGLTWSDGAPGASGFWSVTRCEDLIKVSRDTTTYSSAEGHIQIYDIDKDALEARASMIDMDPPVHTRLRRVVSSAFTPRHVESYRDAVQSRVTMALDDVVAGGGGEWVKKVAAPIPIGVICDIMGVPAEDEDFMVSLSDHLVAGTGAEPLEPTAYGNTTDLRLLPFNSPAAFAMSEYATALGKRRSAQPEDDLVSKLVHAEIDGEKLTEEEFANFFRLMIFAGNETTRSSIAHLVLHMRQFPEAFDAVRANPELISSVADEVVRYSSPILYFRRTTTAPTVLAGTELAAGEKVVMWYAAANFDEAAIDEPLAFRPDRPSTPSHVGFGGGGAHFCLGASLARLELCVLIEEMLRRNITFEHVGEPEFVESNFVNGIDHLEVTL